jgi:hypothetical protein
MRALTLRSTIILYLLMNSYDEINCIFIYLFFLDLSFIWTSFWSYCGCDHMCMCEFYLLFRAAWICERIMKINEKSLGLKINGYLCCFHILLFFFFSYALIFLTCSFCLCLSFNKFWMKINQINSIVAVANFPSLSQSGLKQTLGYFQLQLEWNPTHCWIHVWRDWQNFRTWLTLISWVI